MAPSGTPDDGSAAAEDADHRAALALEAGGMGSFDWHLPTNALTGDHSLGALWGKSLEGPVDAGEFFDSVHPDDLDALRSALDTSLREDSDYDATFRVLVGNAVRWLGARGRVVERDPDGVPVRMLGINWDLTREKRQEEQLAHLTAELNHRVNNSFAVMEALLVLGSRSARDLGGFAETMRAQVHALADAHQLVVGHALHTPDHRVDVRMSALAGRALRKWIDAGDRPPDLRIDAVRVVPPNRVAALSMLLRELATNATRYGVLGRVPGHLEIEVNEEGGTSRLVWTERYDTPIDAPHAPAPDAPSGSTGFGDLLLEHCASMLGGTIETKEAARTGYTFALRFPTPDPDDGAGQRTAT